MLEEQLDEKLNKELIKLEDRLKPKIKKRIKMGDIENKMANKVNMIDFMKQIERIDNNVQVFCDKVDYKLPAMEFEFNRSIINKAEKESVEKLKAEIVDKAQFQGIVDRINKIEEKFDS